MYKFSYDRILYWNEHSPDIMNDIFKLRENMYNLRNVYLENKIINLRILITKPNRSGLHKVFCKKILLEISQSSQENTCARVSF